MPHEETRKIIKVGKTSYAVILPKSWLRFYKLTDRDRVKVTSNSTIVIEPPILEEETKTNG
jgi:phosphate uptake regulator